MRLPDALIEDFMRCKATASGLDSILRLANAGAA